MGLRRNVINAFVSDPVKWVNFSFMNRMIAPIGFYQLVRDLQSDVVHVEVDSTLKDRAEYDPSSNTIRAIDHSFGETFWDEKAALIHEGAHAMLDRFFVGQDINGKKSTS